MPHLWFIRRKRTWRRYAETAGILGGIGPVSNGTCSWFPKPPILEPSGETESGSAGTQPDKGYPGSGAPMARQAPDSKRRQGPFSYLPLDTGSMPQKILRHSRLLADIAGPGTLQPDEP